MQNTIYVTLLEGTETLAPCQGRKISDGLYEIVNNPYLDLDDDATSIWEFFPGDIVSCENIEDRLIAFKLVESKFLNRKLYELIFLVIKSQGEVEAKELTQYQSEVRMLCDKNSVVKQKDHPVLKKWLQRTCVY